MTSKNIELNLKVGFSGFYTLAVRKARTNELVRTIGPFKNAITDIGLERCATGSAATVCYYGTGTIPASTSDTQMGAQTGFSGAAFGSTTTRTTSSPYWVQNAITFRFNPTGSNQNLTEVGVGWSTSSTGALWSRALIVDGGGSPVTLTLLADEYLDVTYSLRYYPPLTDSSYSVLISGVTYNFVTRLANATSSPFVNPQSSVTTTISNLFGYSGTVTLGAVTSSLNYSGTFSALANATASAYVPASLSRSYTSLSGLGQGNLVGGISGITGSQLSGIFGCQFQSTVSPAIPKDNTKSLSLSFAFSWDRY